MRMPRASRFSTFVELPDLTFELLPLSGEVSLVGDYQLFARRSILSERFVIGVDRFEEGSDQPADKDTRQIQPSRGYVESYGTVRHHLRRVHLPPHPLGRRLK